MKKLLAATTSDRGYLSARPRQRSILRSVEHDSALEKIRYRARSSIV